MLFICISLPIVTLVYFTFLFSSLRLSFNVEDLLFWSEEFLKTKKKKSSGFQCRNPFPILYSREYVASLEQFGGDILIYFIYLFLSYDKKTQTLLRNTLPEIILTVYQVFLQIRLYPVIAQLWHAYATSCAISLQTELCGK